jgi:hypothetical protein
MFGPRRPQKTYTHYRQIVPAGSDISRGSSSTLGIDPTFGGIRAGLGQRHGRRISTSKEDISIAPGPSPPGSPPGTRPEQTGLTGRSVASASCPPRTSARLMASAARLQGWSRQWTTWPGSSRHCYTSSAWEVTCSWADKVSSRTNSASVHADTVPPAPAHRRAAEGSLTEQEKP